MAPPITVTALLIALALVPGWLHLSLVERLQPRSASSGLHQLLEVLAVGTATSGAAALLVTFVPVGFTVDAQAWADEGNPYLRAHVHRVAGTVALVFVVAIVLAYLLYRLRARRRPAEFTPHSDVWVDAIGTRPPGTHPFIGLAVRGKGYLEGSLLSYTVGGEVGKREIALQAPIRITVGKNKPTPLPYLQRLVIAEPEIEYITVMFMDAATSRRPSPSSRVTGRVVGGLRTTLDALRARRPRSAGSR